jgi:hypothetical protein
MVPQVCGVPQTKTASKTVDMHVTKQRYLSLRPKEDCAVGSVAYVATTMATPSTSSGNPKITRHSAVKNMLHHMQSWTLTVVVGRLE